MFVGTNALSQVVIRMLFALLLGGAIGLERGYHGRPAGFRTHALVCLASSILMLVPMFSAFWMDQSRSDLRPSFDPTRMAQGIMTGIGFLGAGVIMKVGLSVRGLTTAASIWTTAAIGILVGVGWYAPAGLAAVLALGTLAAFRWIEKRIRHETFAELMIRLDQPHAFGEPEVVAMVVKHGFTVSDVTHWFRRTTGGMEYHMTLCTLEETSVRRLSEALRGEPGVVEFKVTPTAS